MKKKIGAILAAAAMACTMTVGVAFSGCGTAQIYDFVMPDGGYDGGKVTITFANTTGKNLEDPINEAISRFNVIYPNITVKVDNSTKDWDEFSSKIGDQIQVGKQPNVAFCYPDHVAFYNQSNAVLALDDFLPGGAYEKMDDGVKKLCLTQNEVDDYIPAFFKEGSAVFEDGKTYTLPFAKSTEVLFYNKTFFDANNLTPPTTWAEMEEVSKKITDIDKKCIAFGYDSEANLFITLCEQYGSPYTSLEANNHFQFDNETNRDFVKMLKRWYDNRYMTTRATYGEYSSNLFKDKKCYMSIGSTGGSSYQDPGSIDGSASFEVGVAPIPQVDPKNPRTILQGPSVCIFKKQNPQEVIASWLLIKFLTTEHEFQGLYSEKSGYAPVTLSTFNSDAYQEFLSEANITSGLTARTAQICKNLAESKGEKGLDAFYTSPAFIGSSKARQQVGTLLKTVLQGKDINQAFAEALEECRHFSGN